MTYIFKRFIYENRGATAVEYAMICAVIFMVILGAIGILGSGVSGIYTQIAAAM